MITAYSREQAVWISSWLKKRKIKHLTCIENSKGDYDLNEVSENLDEFKALHPAYQVLTRGNMLGGLSAPIHQGAFRYYQEVGLDKEIDPKFIVPNTP